MLTRRHLIQRSAAAAGITLLPFTARADGHSGDVFDTPAGAITIHPISHASFVMETPARTIYVDPVGGAAAYDGLPAADLILITHEHGDHFDLATLTDLAGPETSLLTNPAVFDQLPEEMQSRAQALENGGLAELENLTITAIPAYNITEERLNFHPQGRDNGYVLDFDGFRVYISGDTEDIPEMRALVDIDLAFVCMNLPFTMSAEAAADAVNTFAPTYVYPYHYRGRDNGTQDPAAFATLLADGIEAKMGGWYG